jgi:hypothetical protein
MMWLLLASVVYYDKSCPLQPCGAQRFVHRERARAGTP